MSSAFIDTSYLLALELGQDQHHQAATAHRLLLPTTRPQLVTTSYIFAEVVTFLNSRALHAKAVQAGMNLLTNPTVQLIPVDDRLFFAGWDYFRRHQDKDYSLADCISFVVMQSLGLHVAYTFDHHFQQAGFKIEP